MLDCRIHEEEPLSEHTPGPIGALLADRFRIDRLVGNGGMASVYQATDAALGRTVAVKLFRTDSMDNAGPERQSGEIALLASLNHYALVTLFDAGTAEIGGAPRTFIVMEFVDGPDLRSRITEGPLRPSEIADMGADLAEALHYVHAKGIIHRDVKPANVLLAPSGFPGRSVNAKLADFGIARLLDEARLTATGALLGTASYLSPEQALGQPLGPPSDVYSLGLVLLECLTGDRAYPGTAVESAMARLQRQPAIPEALGPEWRELLEAMTNREPADRPSASEASVALRALRALVDADPTAPPLLSPAGAALGAGEATAATQLLTGGPAEPTAATQLLTGAPAEPLEATAATQLLATGPAPATRPLPVSADPAAATAVFAAPDPAAPPSDERASRDAKSPRRRKPRRKRTPIVLAVLAVALAAALAFVFFPRPAEPEATPPNYPAVGGELGTHLEQLQESVKP